MAKSMEIIEPAPPPNQEPDSLPEVSQESNPIDTLIEGHRLLLSYLSSIDSHANESSSIEGDGTDSYQSDDETKDDNESDGQLINLPLIPRRLCLVASAYLFLIAVFGLSCRSIRSW